MNRKPLRLSSLNRFPASYMLIGMWFSFEPNLIVTSRQTYDLLNFLGDIGGLDGTLTIIGHLLLSSYNNLNAYGVLISLLFRKSG
jgi:hypothetical protein